MCIRDRFKEVQSLPALVSSGSMKQEGIDDTVAAALVEWRHPETQCGWTGTTVLPWTVGITSARSADRCMVVTKACANSRTATACAKKPKSVLMCQPVAKSRYISFNNVLKMKIFPSHRVTDHTEQIQTRELFLNHMLQLLQIYMTTL